MPTSTSQPASRWSGRVAVLALALPAIASTPARACDFCMADLQGFGKSFREADGLAEAKVTGRQILFVAGGEGRVATTFEIVRPLAGAAPEAGTPVRTTVQWKGGPDARRAVVLFDRTADGHVLLDAVADPDGKLADYFGEAFRLDRKDGAARARFFAARLESADPAIAEDAFGQFADIPVDAVAKAKDALPAGRLREWLRSDKVPAARKGLYGLMLGIAGTGEDAVLLGEVLRDCTDAAAAGGLLAGRALLTGKAEAELTDALTGAGSSDVLRRGALAAAKHFRSRGGADEEAMRRVYAAGLRGAESAAPVVDEFGRAPEAWMTKLVREAWADKTRRTEGLRFAVFRYARRLPEADRRELYAFLDAEE